MRMILMVALVMAATLVAATLPITAQEEDATAQQYGTTQEDTAAQEGTLVFVPPQTVTVDGTEVVNEPPGATLTCSGAPFVFEEVEGGTCVYEQTGSPTDLTCDVPTTLTANVLGLSVPFGAFECGEQQPEQQPEPQPQPLPEESGGEVDSTSEAP